MIISVCGFLGYETALKLLEENREFLENRFSKFFIRQIEKLGESETIGQFSDADLMLEIKEGGLFGALWQGASELECGIEVVLSDIPVAGEVIEVMELFDESPYESSSAGSFLAFSSEGKELPEGFTEIGRTTDSKERVIIAQEGKRFLTPPARQKKDIANRKIN